MSHEKLLLYEPGREVDIRMDLIILRYLRDEMLIGNLDYICVREPFRQGVFSSETNESWEYFRRRALYQVGLGFADPLLLNAQEERRGRRADEKIDRGYLCRLRLTPMGFMRIQMLEKEMKKYEGLNRHISQLKEFYEKIASMKGGMAIIFTSLLIVCIFTLDIKVSKIIQKIPILNSVIDIKMLEQFEAINENDEFYQVAMSDSGLLSLDLPNTQNTLPASNLTSKSSPDYQTEKSKIKNITVRIISPVEKLFKITMSSGLVRYIQVRKGDGEYIVTSK